MDVSETPDGEYDIGLMVLCGADSFVSDQVRGTIDCTLPRVMETSPQSSLMLEWGSDITVMFSEALHCDWTVISLFKGQSELEAITNFTLVYKHDQLRVMFDAEQVAISECCTSHVLYFS